MAQTDLSPTTSAKITIMNKKRDQTPGPIKTEKIKNIDGDAKNKLQRTFFNQRAMRNSERKYSSSKVNNVPSSSTTDSFSDEENIKNVVRWLETLPSNQEWCKLEEDPLDRQGDFGKRKESQTKNETYDSAQPSTSYQKNPSESSSSEKPVSIIKETTFKKTPRKVTFENQRRESSKLTTDNRLKKNSDNIGKMKTSLAASLRNDHRRSVPGYKNKEEMVQVRRHSYNLRNLESRKISVIDNQEKISRSRRSSIRCQENRRRSRDISTTRGLEQNEQKEESSNPRKMKSPFTKQARSSTPSLLSDLPHLSSFNLNELKDLEENDKASEKEVQYDRRTIITRSKLQKNSENFLNSVKEIINNTDTTQDFITSLKKCPKTPNEKMDKFISRKNSEELRRTLIKLNNPLKSKPAFINAKLEEKLNSEMEITVNRYKRSYANRKNFWLNKENSFDQFEEPPEKKKKLLCKL
ncbi:uncharacterized protein LOC122505086 [Leptopilina heterotoma]|uniref:uncharacterized protein LOC122505086 n=1 Tax=Leptopilina heterotoma TaxID=63436 RepID=UPI001CA8EB52|nr:uncharacterized protein LOC122505086 [Leptopilina heterotoma]